MKENGFMKLESTGLGIEGKAITKNLMKAGCELTVNADMSFQTSNVASTLGYSNNLKKRMLVTEQDPFFCVIVPTFQNPNYLQFINGIEQVANKAGFAAFILNSYRSAELERQQINSLIQNNFRSLLLMSVDDSADTLRHYLDLGGFACVFESNFPDHTDVLYAKANRFEAGRIATEYLLDQGHRSIAFVTTPLKHFQSRRLTLDGCRFAIEKHALTFSYENIFMAKEESESVTGMYEFETGYSMAEMILQHQNRYTGVVCQNDMIAYGLIAGIKAAGGHVPSNISVVGIDNIPFNDAAMPGLTTVDVSAGMLAQHAAQFIVHLRRRDEDVMRIPLSMKPELVIRGTVRII